MHNIDDYSMFRESFSSFHVSTLPEVRSENKLT
jgi:hypothetical protein